MPTDGVIIQIKHATVFLKNMHLFCNPVCTSRTFTGKSFQLIYSSSDAVKDISDQVLISFRKKFYSVPNTSYVVLRCFFLKLDSSSFNLVHWHLVNLPSDTGTYVGSDSVQQI